MPYSPLALSNTFVDKYGRESGIDHMKLQKLAFYSYGWWLAYNNQPILTEGPEVWRFGPVFSSLYRVLATHRMTPIKQPQKAVPVADAPLIPMTDALAHQWVDWIWQRYGSLSAMALSNMTHEVGSPWQTEAAEKQYRVPLHHRISDDRIKSYFQAEAAKLNAASA